MHPFRRNACKDAVETDARKCANNAVEVAVEANAVVEAAVDSAAPMGIAPTDGYASIGKILRFLPTAGM